MKYRPGIRGLKMHYYKNILRLGDSFTFCDEDKSKGVMKYNTIKDVKKSDEKIKIDKQYNHAEDFIYNLPFSGEIITRKR